MSEMLNIPIIKRVDIWTRMNMYLSRHTKMVKNGACDTTILQYYWMCMGMLECVRMLGIFEDRQLDQFEDKLYRPYEK